MVTFEDPEGLYNLNFILAHSNIGIMTIMGNYYRKHLKTTAARIFLEVNIFNLKYKEKKQLMRHLALQICCISFMATKHTRRIQIKIFGLSYLFLVFFSLRSHI